MIGCLGWFVDLGIRLGTPDGQELAGRAATFVYIPVSVLAAIALTRLVNSGPVRRWGVAVTAVVVASIVSLLLDGLANGWPPFWERLPGPHLVASFEASVNPEEVAASNWSLAQLGPGNRIAADNGHLPGAHRLRRPEPAAGRSPSCTPPRRGPRLSPGRPRACRCSTWRRTRG